jgi:outer membrane protein OmpA-like peptidoglycan-associated protein
VSAPSICALSAALSLALVSPGFISRAHADPVYSPEAVIAVFVKDRAVAEAYKSRTTRAICLGAQAGCSREQAPARAIFDLLVSFQNNSDRLTPAAKDNLRQFAKALADPLLKGAKFEIDAHTSAAGSEEFNLHLSQRRAASVVSYLALQGVDSFLLSFKGLGATEPRVADPYSAENNRVEAHLTE